MQKETVHVNRQRRCIETYMGVLALQRWTVEGGRVIVLQTGSRETLRCRCYHTRQLAHRRHHAQLKKKKKGAVAHPFPSLLHIRATRGHYAQRELAEVSALTCLTRQVHVLLEIRLWAGEREKASQSVSSISFQVVEPHSGTVRRFHPNALGKKNNNMHLISAASLTAVAPGLQTNSSTQTSLRKIQPCGV